VCGIHASLIKDISFMRENHVEEEGLIVEASTNSFPVK
jgi:hypothetical protein